MRLGPVHANTPNCVVNRGSYNDKYAYFTVHYGAFVPPSGVYLDPPFNSNATYNVLFQEQGESPLFWKTSVGGAGGKAAQAKTDHSLKEGAGQSKTIRPIPAPALGEG